jgi:RNA polymerase sigma factor (sigma-70 family)
MSNRRSGKHLSEKSDAALLRQLNTSDAWNAWTEFLRRHAPSIMKTVSRIEFQQDRKNECFLFVSEKLSEDGFRRLLKYDSTRNASVRTWLVTVVFNLCIDWHRKEFGRAFLLPAITAMSSFDQLVYRYSFQHGMSHQDCIHALSADFPDVTRNQLSRAISRVHEVLTPRQRWQLGVRQHRKKSSEYSAGESCSQDVDQLPAPNLNPAAMAQRQQEREALHAALAQLSVRDRLLLHLRFNAGLSLNQIARFVGLGNSARAWRHIDKALKALSDQFPSREFPGLRKK